ncbi:MAG: helix-turn-helix domain-containing protein [Lachnospiraceae bacterium]
MQITRALEYVGDHYDREIKIGDLAHLCHLSETHFRRIFARCMGVHPIDYVNQVRIRNACQLLKKTNDSIMEISIKCGFGSSAAFNRNFRKFMGVTPNEWRKLPENYERRLTKNNISYYDGW